jgi:hypothetical protein
MMQLPAALIDRVGKDSSSGSCARHGRKIIKESNARKKNLWIVKYKKKQKSNEISK